MATTDKEFKNPIICKGRDFDEKLRLVCERLCGLFDMLSKNGYSTINSSKLSFGGDGITTVTLEVML